MGYRTDQWYDLSNPAVTGEDLSAPEVNRSGYYLTDADNQEFSYPDRFIRTGSNSTGDRTVSILKRGYIRSLKTAENKTGLPDRKCQFQFNPQFLVQSVSQNTSILNFLQQDPGQYAQPIPGNVSFSFELFFDRSMEMNNKDSTLSDYSDISNPWGRSPHEVGVLHDINAFYSVIGVGLSDKMSDYAQKVLDNQINAAAYEANLQASSSEEDGPTFSTEDIATASTQASDFLKYNFGNTAFLLPLPVRIVFSSLYIVEGLVKDVTVTFTKFNAAMVPMQCTLNVLFEAKYIGFANKNTFFTQVLEDYENLDPNSISFDTDIDPEELKAYKDAITNDLEQAQMAVVFSDDDDSGRAYSFYTSAKTWGSDNDDQHWFTSLVSNQDGAGPGTKLEEGMEKNIYYFKVGFPKARVGSRLVQLANQGKDVSIDVEARYSLWRWSEEVKDEYEDEWNAARQPTGGAKKNYTTPAHEPPQRSAGRTFFGKLWDWTPELGQPSTFNTDDNGGNERAFRHVIRLHSAELNSSNVLTTAKDADNEDIEISLPTTGLNALQNAFNAGLTSKSKIEYNDGFYDRSVDLTNEKASLLPDKFPEYRTDQGSPFYFGIEYEVKVSVSIDGNEFPSTRVVDHVLIPHAGYGNTDDGGSGTYISTKLVTLDWGGSFADIDEAIEEASQDQLEQSIADALEQANANASAGAAGI